MTYSPWEPAFWLVKPLKKSVSPFGGDLCFGWLGSLRLYLYKPLGCVSAFWNWMPAGKDKTMKQQKVLMMPESIPYLSVGLDVGADFTWMSIMLPNGILTGKPFKIIHSDPESRELAVKKIKEAQEMYSLESRCFLKICLVNGCIFIDGNIKGRVIPLIKPFCKEDPMADYYENRIYERQENYSL